MTVRRGSTPFRAAVEALKLAKKVKAHPAFIERLEQRVQEEANSFYTRLKTIDFNFPVVSCLEANISLSDALDMEEEVK